jgi:Domain of unknown function (DUF4399)
MFMKKNAFMSILALSIFVIACNNSAEDSADKTDSAAHDSMDHSMPAAVVPDVPPVPEGARIFFKNLTDGQTVTSPVKVEMGIEGMSVDTARGIVAGSGHHHILIDAGDSLARGTVVPKDSTHLHFGNAQTEAEVPLSPGQHRLTLQFADGIHRSYGSRLAASITVNVKK